MIRLKHKLLSAETAGGGAAGDPGGLVLDRGDGSMSLLYVLDKQPGLAMAGPCCFLPS